MEHLTLKKIRLEPSSMGTKVLYDYDAPESLTKYIKGSPLFVEFPGDVRSVAEAILTIPFVGIMLTVTMLLDIEIRVPSLDKAFHNSLKEVEAVFQNMYPKAGIQCRVKVPQLISNVQSAGGTTDCSLFFTGGVDATSALVELAEKKPLLINIWGGDLRLTDDASHEELERYLDRLTAHLGLHYCFIKTNAREMFEENSLGFLCEKLLGHERNHGWWASIAHILSMSSTIAPWLWHKGISIHYIGSSYDPATKTFDANNGMLIEALTYMECRFVSVDARINRNEKATKIVTYRETTQAPIELKVCWNRTAGVNCSACEKCYRTILNIMSNHGDPNQYGFTVNSNTIKQMQQFVRTNTVSSAFWLPIQKAMVAEREFWTGSEMEWFLDAKLNSVGVYLQKIRKKLQRK